MIHPASEAQIQAADPQSSTWLSANAGSGKTRVLTGRVAWLMLEGVAPERILCLTYTKAAASEMQNRLFKRLGEWTMLPDPALEDALVDLGVARAAITPDRLRHARTLFARAIEAPGGLKIQTFHAFCASLLRRFPLEAGVSPQFQELDERKLALLCQDILDQMAEGPEAPAVAAAFDYLGSDDAVMQFVQAILKDRTSFAASKPRAEIFDAFDIPPNLSPQGFACETLGESSPAITTLASLLDPENKQQGPARKRLEAMLAQEPGLESLALLEQVFLTGAKAKAPFTSKAGKFPTAALRRQLGDETCATLDALMDRVETARQMRLNYLAATKTAALHAFAYPFITRFQQAKTAQGGLDFTDLISKTRTLLARSDVAAWVLYRLDGGIDHVLVDEAQDTSPEQWEVITSLTQEFTAGIGTDEARARRVFVVGDKKQSIYSFQGAAPDQFDRQRDQFETRFQDAVLPFAARDLTYSFRSAPLILDLVDRVFTENALEGLGGTVKHEAFFPQKPGRITLWDPIEPTEKEEETRAWFDPIDQPGRNHHHVLMGQKVAGELEALLASRVEIEVGGERRPVRPDDILILVQRRKEVFHQIVAACKARGLPIAGADVLKINGELAVQDILSVLRFLALPEDDLSLAEALRSPLFELSEADLFSVCHDRRGATVWDNLRAHRERYSAVVACFEDLRDQVDYLRPYEIIDRLLTRHDGRRKIKARLGGEAEEAVDALLTQALLYETSGVPSLDGFLVWFDSADIGIKRRQEAGSGLIRVMTVHGAKGLEAPVVILPETEAITDRKTPPLLEANKGVMAWSGAQAEQPEALLAAQDQHKAQQKAERNRLLYVALTRAESWLIIGAAGNLGKETEDSWYGLISKAAETFEATRSGDTREIIAGDWPVGAFEAHNASQGTETALPDWLDTHASAVHPPLGTRAPSDLGGAKVLVSEEGQASEIAMAEGTALHKLLEELPHVPPAEREMAALNMIDTTLPPSLVQRALDLIEHPKLTWLFASDTLSEVSFSAPAMPGDDRPLAGAIDKLVIREDVIWAVDYKSNKAVPPRPEDVPVGILRQMAAYHHALHHLYPGHTIQTAILWTETGEVMALPHDLVINALPNALDG